MLSSKVRTLNHPPTLVFPPSQSHKITLIVLHGRGSTAERFAEPLLTHQVSPLLKPLPLNPIPKTFCDHLPNAKFIFPTASLRRAVAFNRSIIHQWFDVFSLTELRVKKHLSVPGLHDTTAYLHELLKAEIELVGAENVILMGLSQGCAASMIAIMLWDGEPLGGFVGMCGWLPFREDMQELLGDDELGREGEIGDEEEDIFERDDELEEVGTKLEQVVQWLREELHSDASSGESHVHPPLGAMPVFMGHGTKDEKVPFAFGESAANFLRHVNVDVEWHEYEGLGHWYSADMLRDIIQFLDRN
ncbi:phospholipase/carboxylesterase family protein-like protein [Paraphoma chrysanthemicola]|uniref:Phospholipase/carboxylesterase family protein-like protein n=1 Tax=Paraphoma chrysanthemicola TaxID=798071 RepID=A0A8K0R6M8_9PLEO|nr:phospholipase/carboxylesterase family protein-like protein [Paraphoma chrysanthemicola]